MEKDDYACNRNSPEFRIQNIKFEEDEFKRKTTTLSRLTIDMKIRWKKTTTLSIEIHQNFECRI